VKLIFKVKGVVADLKFKVERLDNKLTLLLALCSCIMSLRHAQDLTTQATVIPDMPIPLHKVNLPGEKDNYSASHGFSP
jgi:hypothetical protein